MDQLARILYMEELLDRCIRDMHDETLRPSLSPMIQELSDYYSSPLWLQDLDDDRAGKLPADLKRGVLSEDAIYDLLGEWDALTEGKRAPPALS